MATPKLSRAFGANQLAAHVSWGYTSMAAAITRLFGVKHISVVEIDTATAARSAHLFAQALHEDSNHEFDWIWYADNIATSAHQRYCLRRALEINPNSEMARRALAKLALHENR